MELKLNVSDLIIPKFDEVLTDVLEHRHTHYALYGGRGSTKSSFVPIATILIMLQNPEIHAVSFRKVKDTLKNSVYNQFLFALSLLGVHDMFRVTKNPLEITLKGTGQKILFRGVDEPHKIKSIKVPFGYIGVTHFEELDQFGERAEIRNILQSTMRGGDKFWNFETFNPPVSASNWANRDLRETRPDRLAVKSDYTDVPLEWLGGQFIGEAEYLKQTNERAYRHEYLGEPVGTGGNVFENVIVREITPVETKTFDGYYYGVDWGYYPDPFAFVKCAYNANKRVLYILDEICAVKQNNRETADMILEKGLTRDDLIICDSAEPKSIADYQEYGLYARGAEKGAGSVKYSMKWLQGLREIVVDGAKCPRSAKEFLEYEYERTRNDEIISGYPDKNNHFIDAARYALNLQWRRGGE